MQFALFLGHASSFIPCPPIPQLTPLLLPSSLSVSNQKGDPCFSGSAVPSTLLVTIWLLHPAPWDLLARAEDPDLPLGMHLAGRLWGISGHQRVPAQATSQLGKPALTSAKKGLQLHCLLRGDLRSSPGSGGKEDTGHRRVCLASAVTPAPACCQLCSLLSRLLHTSVSFWSSSPLSLSPPFPSLCSCC